MKYERIMCIDPGKESGIAYFFSDRLHDVQSTNFWGVISRINSLKARGYYFILELPETKHVWHNEATSKKAIQRTGVNVGSAIREAELIRDYLEMNMCNYETVTPKGKITSKEFKERTGWKGRTNQHQRDAAMLYFYSKINLTKK